MHWHIVCSAPIHSAGVYTMDIYIYSDRQMTSMYLPMQTFVKWRLLQGHLLHQATLK